MLRHPLSIAVVATTLMVLVLRLATYGNGGGGGLQVAQQLLMPIPVAIGAWACASRLRLSWMWLLPLAVFLVAAAFVYTALQERRPDADGSTYCAAWGVLPPLPDWEDARWATAAPVVAGLAVLGGFALRRRPQAPWPGSWLCVAGLTLAVTWFAAPVCVGA